MQKRFRLDHRHYHHMHDPEIAEMLKLLHEGMVSTEQFIQARLRDDVTAWLDQFARDTWRMEHVVEREGEYMMASDYWLFTDDDNIATLFKLAWL
jgi:hypothetical protein